jgi:hypothetical protein
LTGEQDVSRGTYEATANAPGALAEFRLQSLQPVVKLGRETENQNRPDCGRLRESYVPVRRYAEGGSFNFSRESIRRVSPSTSIFDFTRRRRI